MNINKIEWRVDEQFQCVAGQRRLRVDILRMTLPQPASQYVDGPYRITVVAGSGCVISDIAGLTDEQSREEAVRTLIAAKAEGFSIQSVPRDSASGSDA